MDAVQMGAFQMGTVQMGAVQMDAVGVRVIWKHDLQVRIGFATVAFVKQLYRVAVGVELAAAVGRPLIGGRAEAELVGRLETVHRWLTTVRYGRFVGGFEL